MDEYRRVEVKFFEEDDKNLAFLMKETGIKNQSTAIRRALKSFRENAELLKTLRELTKGQEKLIKEQEAIKTQLNNYLIEDLG